MPAQMAQSIKRSLAKTRIMVSSSGSLTSVGNGMWVTGLGRCSTTGGSQGLTIVLKPRGDITRNPKQNRTCICVRQKTLERIYISLEK